MDYFENQSLDAKDMHPEYRRAEEAYRAEAARLWESEQRIREGIRAQTDLTDEERQERYMAAYEDLNGRFERLANGFASDVHKRLRADRQKLEKGAGERFGEYLISLSSRDADELPALMETARRTGQEDLERAVAQVALDKGRLGVFQEWAERNPERGEAYRRLKSTPSAGQLRTRALGSVCKS